ncbi:MAG: succinylglutamate desuccinylase/aspartoacylase family protein [Planctomycetota bacterium]
MKAAPHEIGIEPLPVSELATGSRTDFRARIYQDNLGEPVFCPFVVVRGSRPGPTLGLTAAVHGDELNGIKIIHHLLETLDPRELSGTLVCSPIVNVPAYQFEQRRFPEDHRDLNTVFPGSANGLPSQQYARAFLTVFLPGIQFLVDIHTASAGRVNSMYVRADLFSKESRELAHLMNPQIVLHGKSGDGTLRSAARRKGIPAITVEAGNPSEFQGRMVDEGELGVLNILSSLGMWPAAEPELPPRTPVVCSKSTWLRTREGGLLDCNFDLCDRLHKKQRIARMFDSFGRVTSAYTAPTDGIVIGMLRSPIAVPGTRYCHLGTIGEPIASKS